MHIFIKNRIPTGILLLLLFLIYAGPCPKPPVPPLVKVKICSVSLLLPNEYCPEIIEKEYKPGTQPTEICTIHQKPIPLKTKVSNPWPESGEIRGISFTLYGGLSGSSAIIDEIKLDSLYENMAIGKMDLERNFGWFADQTDAWRGNYLLPWNDDWSWNEEYWAQIDRRLTLWCGERNGAEIISILDACSLYEGDSWDVNPLNKLVARSSMVFSAGPARDQVIRYARELVHRTAKFAPRIIFETRNEGNQIVGFDSLHDYDRAVIAALHEEGVPSASIQINWFDSSLFYDLLLNDLGGKGLAATHQVGSEKSVNWYRDSPGKQGLMALGDYPCSDGPDFYPEEPQGLFWFWLPGGQGRRSSNSQLAYIRTTMRDLKFPRFEHLSAAGFTASFLPDLLAAAGPIGQAEMFALR